MVRRKLRGYNFNSSLLEVSSGNIDYSILQNGTVCDGHRGSSDTEGPPKELSPLQNHRKVIK